MKLVDLSGPHVYLAVVRMQPCFVLNAPASRILLIGSMIEALPYNDPYLLAFACNSGHLYSKSFVRKRTTKLTQDVRFSLQLAKTKLASFFARA